MITLNSHTEPDVPDFDRQLAEMRAKLKAAKRGRMVRWAFVGLWSIGISAVSFEAGKFWNGTFSGTIRAATSTPGQPVGLKTLLTGPRGGRYHYSDSGTKVYDRR